MSRQRILVTDFTRGMVSPRMVPRIDQTKAVQELVGFTVLPDGGIRRREGTIFTRTGLGVSPADGVIPSFTAFDKRIAGTETLHIAWVNDDPKKLVIQNMINRTLQEIAETTLEAGVALDDSGKFNNSLSTLYAQNVHLWTPGASHMLDLELWTLTQKTSQEISTIYQARMIAVDRTWGTVYMSIPYIYLDFDTDGHLELIPDFYGYESPRWVLAFNGSVYIGTDKSEWMLSSGFPYFTDDLGGLMMQKISGIGTDLATVFGPAIVLAKDRRLMRIAYSGAGAFQSQSLAELIDNKDIVQIQTIEYGSHRYLFFIDTDRRLWTLTECENTGVTAWHVLAENVGWLKAYGQDLYAAILRGSDWAVEVFPMDNLNFPGNRTQGLKDVLFDRKVYGDSGGFLVVDYDATEGYSVTGDYLPESQTMEVYLPGGTYIGQRATTAAGVLTGTAAEIATWAGYDGEQLYLFCYPSGKTFTSKVKTLPLEMGTAMGPGLGSLRRIHGVVIRVYESKALRVRAVAGGEGGRWENWSSSTLFTGNVELPIDCPHTDLVQLEIESVGDSPLHIHSIQIDATMGDE
jgi:hypothetical protein